MNQDKGKVLTHLRALEIMLHTCMIPQHYIYIILHNNLRLKSLVCVYFSLGYIVEAVVNVGDVFQLSGWIQCVHHSLWISGASTSP